MPLLTSWTRSLRSWRQTWDLVCLLLMWMLVSALWTSAPASADAEPPPAEQGLILPKRVLEQCEADALRVDLLEPALRGCQRDLDAGAGALGESRQTRAAIEEERRQLERRVAELEASQAARWGPLVWWGLGVASAVGAALIVALAVD